MNAAAEVRAGPRSNLEAEFQAAFDAGLGRLAGRDGSGEARRQAMAAFARRGFPSRRDEDWRYTDLKPILTGGFDPLPPPPDEAQRHLELERLRSLQFLPDAVPLLFADGRRTAVAGSPPLPAGVEILEQDEAWRRLRAIQSRDQFHDYPLSAINTAFSPGCTLLRVAADADVRQPLHVLYGGAQTTRAAQARLVIELGRGSRLCVVQHFAARGGGWTNSVTQTIQEPASRLILHRLQEHAEAHCHTELLHARLAREATARLGYADIGARLVRNDLRVELAEPGAGCDIAGVFLASRGQHVDNHTRVDHIAPHTTSSEAFRGIVGERGRGVFNGKVVVHAGARGTDARQSSDNLLLADRAEVNTKPELEIYTDDVKCAHGATVGELDVEQLFYLRSRGLDEATARNLLIFAFANALLRRIETPELRERIVAAVAGHLPDCERWRDLL